MNGFRGALAFVLLFISGTSNATTFASDFVTELTRNRIPLRPDRIEQTAAQLFLAKPGLLEDWGIINSTASASYSGLLRTIVFKPDLLDLKSDGKLQIASMRTLSDRHGLSAIVHATTIVHELAHAEYERLVKKHATLADLELNQVFKDEIEPWFDRRARFYQFLWADIAASEVFAYYRGDLITFLNDELEQVLNFNGLSVYDQSRCYKLKRHTENFFLPGAEADRLYRDRYRLEEIWVKGTLVPLSETDQDPFLPRWQRALWTHFEALLSPPRSKREIAAWLNRNPYWRAKLSRCASTALL